VALKLICGPSGSGKTARAIDAFLDALARGQKAIFIAPSGPDARHFEREILRKLGDGNSPGVLTDGKVTTFDGFYSELLQDSGASPQVLGSNERLLLLKATVDSCSSRLKKLQRSSAYDGFVTSLGKLIGELRLAGIDSTRLGRTLRTWAKDDSWRQGLNKDVYRLYEKYEAVLSDKQLLDTEMLQRQVLQLLRGRSDSVYNTMVIHGFWDFTPVQHDIIEVFSESVDDLLVTVPFEPGRIAYDAPSIHRDRLLKLTHAREAAVTQLSDSKPVPPLEHLVANLFSDDIAKRDADGAVSMLLAAGIRGQAEVIAAEIIKLWRGGHSLDEIAVVCRSVGPDLTTLAEVFREFRIPYEFSRPLPLADTTLGRTLSAAFDFVRGFRPRESLLAYIRSPLVDIPIDQADLFGRDMRLRNVDDPRELLMEWKRARYSRSLDELGALADSLGGVAELGAAVRTLSRELLTNREYVIQASAEDLKFDMLSLRSLDALCVETANVQEIMDETSSGSTAKATDQTGVEMFIGGLRQATLRLSGSTQRGCVRLLDPHRILNQRFDTVFVCGMLERQFPDLGREDAFFPDAERQNLNRDFGMALKTRDHRLAEERFLYLRTLSRARKKVYLCYPSCDQEGKPTVRSLFVDDTLELFDPDTVDILERSVSDITFAPDEAPTADQAMRSLALLDDSAGRHRKPLLDAAAAAGLRERLESCLGSSAPRSPHIGDPVILERLGRQTLFNVTEVQRHLRCPFSYFVEDLLSPARWDPVARGLQRGSILHSILCKFNGQLNRSQVILSIAKPRQIEELRRQMRGFIEEEFVDTEGDLETLILKTELSYHLDRYIDLEINSRRQLKNFDVEVSFGSKAGMCGGRNSTEQQLNIDDFHLRGRLDRVDLDGDSNRAIVIDYKASRSVGGQRDFEKTREIQIPLYMLALRDAFGLDPIGGEYLALRGDKRGGLYLEGYEDVLGIGAGQIEVNDFVDAETFGKRLEAARVLAGRVVSDIRRGSFPAEPREDEKNCDYCSYDSICRRKALPERLGMDAI